MGLAVKDVAARQGRSRPELLNVLAKVGRQNSDATVLFHAAVAQRMGLNLTDYKTLGVLERAGPLSAGEIAKLTGLATASITNLIDRLEARGLVKRTHDPKDRRRILVSAVNERLGDARALFRSTIASLARLYKSYSDPELAVIADFLERNAERLRKETVALEKGSAS